MSRIVTEREFAERISNKLFGGMASCYKGVTGPGRSGAVAAVYASHITGLPFLPYGTRCPKALQPLLIVDTATNTGSTLRKAARKYEYAGGHVLYGYDEKREGRVLFWYESQAIARLNGDIE